MIGGEDECVAWIKKRGRKILGGLSLPGGRDPRKEISLPLTVVGQWVSEEWTTLPKRYSMDRKGHRYNVPSLVHPSPMISNLQQ